MSGRIDIRDKLNNPNSIIPTGTREYNQKSASREYIGLQLKVGVVIKVNKKNFSVTLAQNIPDKKYWEAEVLKDSFTVQAQLLQPMLGMSVSSVPAVPKYLENFSCEAQFPPIGSSVVYANIYGVEGRIQNTIVLGCFYPTFFQYNAATMEAGIEATFAALNARKLINSPTGYYWYETENGQIITGKVSIVKAPGMDTVTKEWEEKRLPDGTWTYITYAVDGITPKAIFGMNTAGKFKFENITTTLKSIVTDLRDVLAHLTDPTAFQVPVSPGPAVYNPAYAAVDIPKLTALSVKIGALLE